MAVLAGSGEGGFDGVVHSIEGKYHVHATRIPLMGIVSAIARTATKDGVSDLHIAEFDRFTEPVDGEELNQMVEQKLGPGWERMIRETSRRGNEQTLIYIHPEANRMALFVLDLNGHELDVVQVSVDPDHLNQSIGKYQHHHRDSDGDGDKSE